ncbi:MAG: type I restriction-modification system endonuclease [Saprospiraceae bacterium]|nr:type I restriction-modification system endonuclease [Saprospiraceae bacterium]
MSFQSNFLFLKDEYPLLLNIGQAAEYYLHTDPVVALVKLRFWGEKITEMLFGEHRIDFPSDNTFHHRLKTLEFEDILPERVKDLLFMIKLKGNVAVHDHQGSLEDAKGALFAAFKVAKWFYETYSEENQDITSLKFSLPPDLDARHAIHTLEQEKAALEAKYNALLEARKTGEIPEEKAQEIKARSQEAARKIEMSEAETRELIDAQLRQAGWEADTTMLNYKIHRSKPQRGKFLAIAEWPAGPKWADYALFIGTELYGIVEAKKYAHDISTDLRQSKIYAELIEEKHQAKLLGKWREYQAPFLFSANGRPYLEQIKTKSGIWFLDVRNERNRARPLRGWFSPEGLKKLFEQNISLANQKLATTSLDFLSDKSGLHLRDYQIQAIESVEKKIRDQPDERKALLAMATGTGKTRTVMGLCYRLIQSNRFRRILFLVDRRLLGTQALNAFKDNKVVGLNTFSEIYHVKELKEIIPDVDTRLQFATVQGMVKRLFYNDTDEEIPSIDTYDCIIVDEAHRGYLMDRELDEDDLDFKNQKDYMSKYRMVLDYFDAYAIGLTATPALHTTEIFGSPVYTYSYREAVVDGWLIDHEPPYVIKTKLSEQGIIWEKGEKPKAYDQETNKIIELDALEDELQIEVDGFNKLVITENFNRTVIKELVKLLDPEGEEKTLIFAAKDEHADRVVQYLKEEFDEIGVDVSDDAIVKITGKSYNPQDLFKRFKNEKYPNIAVTVDLLTTGIDVPSICNLVFLRRVRSRILYEQMLGRATRRCDEIGKEVFRIFDAVRIYEALEDYTSMKPVVVNPNASFQQLAEELDQIDNVERVKKQLGQIIAKLQRKKGIIQHKNEETFKYLTGDQDPESFIKMLNDLHPEESAKRIGRLSGLWKFLDELKPIAALQLISEHDDAYLGTDRGYGKGQKPDDYLRSFEQFIQENLNKISALKIICTRPRELDRKSLRELKILLDQEGYNARSLNIAWKETKNEDIAADIITYIRTLAMGSALISHENRIRNAMQKVRNLKTWNLVQQRWIDRFEMQLMQETILQKQNMDEDPFLDAGGFTRLNKIFNDQLEQVIDLINENLYQETA